MRQCVRDISTAICEGVDSIFVLGIIWVVPSDILNVIGNFVSLYLCNVLSSCKFLTTSSIHFERCIFLIEFSKLLDNFIILDFGNFSLDNHPNRVIFQLRVRIVENSTACNWPDSNTTTKHPNHKVKDLFLILGPKMNLIQLF